MNILDEKVDAFKKELNELLDKHNAKLIITAESDSEYRGVDNINIDIFINSSTTCMIYNDGDKLEIGD